MSDLSALIAQYQADILLKLPDGVSGGIKAAALRAVEDDIVAIFSAINAAENNVRHEVSDANYAATVADRCIAFTTLTTSRTVLLQPANLISPTAPVIIADESGDAGPGKTITAMVSGLDRLNSGTELSIEIPRGILVLWSNAHNAYNTYP